MPNRLEPVNLVDFTGGLNLRRNQFQLNANESPEMVNITIDPLGGIYTRRGWQRWNGPDIVPEGEAWDPRRAQLVQLSDGTDVAYIAANNKVYWASAPIGATFAQLGTITVSCVPHMADFATFGDDLYIAGGRIQSMYRRHQLEAVTTLTLTGAGSWNDDYLTPVHGVGPAAECIEAHSGYLFAANLSEDGLTFPNRLRWSHPTSPDDWAQADFIDIDIGGSEISGLMSYEDHLLIFKHDSIWALYGYNAESWQLVQKSSTIGAFCPQSITRSEQVVFFFSASDRGGIYAYAGERPAEVSTQLRDAFEQIVNPEFVWVGWIARKLWVTLPWTYDGPTLDNASVVIFDPTVGDGAWMYYLSRSGALGPIMSGSNIDSMARPLGVMRDIETSSVVQLEALDRAIDNVWRLAVLGVDNGTNMLVTGDDKEIIVSGALGEDSFETVYRTPWITADWPSRKKSFRRPDIICRYTGLPHRLQIRSFRDYEELNAKRTHVLEVPSGAAVSVPGTTAAVWNQFTWNDGTLWNQGGISPTATSKSGATIRRGSSYGLCRALQLRIEGLTPKARWGIDAFIVKTVMRRFR